jgi:fibronectin type 3 domain-containing protein
MRKLLVCLLLTGTVFAQKKPSSVAVMARPMKDSILLRWAPVNDVLWKKANVNGYMIRRFTLLRNGKLLPVPEEQVLTTQPLVPLPEKAWEQVLKVNEKYGAIAAQALYGESFEVDAVNAKDVMTVYHRAQEQQSRYSFTLFSADQSFPVARAAALGFVDKTVHSNEKYLYQIYVGNSIDTGAVFTGYADYAEVPVPYDVQAMNMQRSVLLSWNKNLFERVFTAYLVERSDDNGKTFQNISDEPIVNADANAPGEQQRYFRMDTVHEADHLYIYRVKGITPFGEISAPSDTVGVYVTELLTARPSITNAAVLPDGKVNVQWHMPADAKHIKAFDLERATAMNGTYAKINQQLLRPSDSSFTDKSPVPSNYYRIKVMTDNGQSAYSFPRFVQLEDSTAPAPPTGLTGKVSDKGVVELTWNKNKEKDIYAYRVFRANVPTAEFVQVTKAPLEQHQFRDTINIKTLTKYIYYNVVALDGHYNPSGFSDTLKLKRPDVIPPVPPVFTDFSVATNGIYLQWQPSTSEDVVKHELLRSRDTVWKVIQSFDTISHYTDTSAVAGVTYYYKVLAEDDSQLKSFSNPVSGARLDLGLQPVKQLLRAVIDREKKQIVLRWPVNNNIEKYWLYRAEPDKPFKLYRTLTGAEVDFSDEALIINKIYRYKIRSFDKKNNSAMSEEVQVKY